MATIKISGNRNISTTKAINVFDKPKYVYLPLISRNDENITVLVKKGNYVRKGMIVGKTKDKSGLPIHSSISGFVEGIVEKTYFNNKKIKCLKIENDFKEVLENEIEPKEKINQYTKEEFVDLLHEMSITGLGGAGFPAYLKYDTNQKIRTLIINGAECEPYITSDDMLARQYMEEILETIDAIMEINKIEEGIIAVKGTYHELIKIIKSHLGTYPHIKLKELPDHYPMGWERTLIREVGKGEYDHLPIEQGIIVQNISTVYAIYQALKFHQPLIERVVTFTGEMLKHPQNVLVRLGTDTKDVIEAIGGYQKGKDIFMVAGGPMMGEAIADEELVISASLNCVLILKEKELFVTTECFRCGKCVSVCPAKIAPVLIKDQRNDVENLKKLQSNRCIGCGLCSYVCPAGIRVRNFVHQANLLLGNEGKK